MYSNSETSESRNFLLILLVDIGYQSLVLRNIIYPAAPKALARKCPFFSAFYIRAPYDSMTLTTNPVKDSFCELLNTE